ncbi:MAG TPA: hypothetical protein DEA47_01005 [Peptococcaceae bacterium]|nr:hypothetical protein [Peptococcaceae bacterium]
MNQTSNIPVTPLGLLKLAALYREKGYKVHFVRKGQLYTKKEAPDFVCITSLFTYAWKPVVRAYRYYHMGFPNAKIRIGGIFASLIPDRIWEHFPEAEVLCGTIEEVDLLIPAWDLAPERLK